MPDPASADLSIAMIGAGFISDYHVSGLRTAGGASVDALVGRDRLRTEARAKALHIPRVETDYRTVLYDRSIDAVVIATPDNTHERIASEALAAGKAVLLQKPMALNGDECRRILKARASYDGRLSVSFMHRYFQEVRWLRDLLAKGSLGRIHAIRLRNATPGADWSDWFYASEQVAGGVAMQLGVHGIDLCRHLFGEIESVTALMTTRKPLRTLQDGRTVRTHLDDTVIAGYVFRDGVVGSHEMSYTEAAGSDRFRLEVYAEQGTVWLRTERGPAALYSPAITGHTDWVRPLFAEEPFGAVHHRHWLNVVRDGAADDTAEAGLASIVVAECLYKSARERCVVDVPVVTGQAGP